MSFSIIYLEIFFLKVPFMYLCYFPEFGEHFITIALICFSGKLLISISLGFFFFLGFALFFHLEHTLLFSHFIDFLCLSL